MPIRIIAGTARGRLINSAPAGPEIRPILARIRKSLFDILRDRIVGSTFLDLYAGVGTVGLEALSRGAKKVVFVDNQKQAVRTINKNLERLGFTEKARVYQSDISQGLGWLKEKFDLIFLGPPYPAKKDTGFSGWVSPTLEIINQAGILSGAGLIVAQHFKKEKIVLPSGYTVFRMTRYGDTCLSFIRRA